MNKASGEKNGLGKTAKDRRNNIVVIILAVLLLTVIVLFVKQKMDHREIVDQFIIEKDSLKSELSMMVVSYDSLKTENDTINEKLFFAQNKVKDLLVEIEQTKRISFEKITDYQKQVTTLRGIMRNFVVQIDSLNRRNQELMAENLEVKEQVKKVESENEKLNEEAGRLQKNLQRAAQLETIGLIAEPINDRSKPTKFAKRSEKIRISLTLSKNVTAKRGAKNIYARIMRPDQLLLSKSPDNLFTFEGLRIQFSAVREVNYEGNELPVAIYWDNAGEAEFLPGNYTVDIFADGNNIGTTTFSLK